MNDLIWWSEEELQKEKSDFEQWQVRINDDMCADFEQVSHLKPYNQNDKIRYILNFNTRGSNKYEKS